MLEVSDYLGKTHKGIIVKQYSECEEFKNALPKGLGDFFLFQSGPNSQKVSLYCVFPDKAKKIYTDPLWGEIVSRNMCEIKSTDIKNGKVSCHLYLSNTNEEEADEYVWDLIELWEKMQLKKKEWAREYAIKNKKSPHVSWWESEINTKKKQGETLKQTSLADD